MAATSPDVQEASPLLSRFPCDPVMCFTTFSLSGPCPWSGLVCTTASQDLPFIEHMLHVRHGAKLFIVFNTYFP